MAYVDGFVLAVPTANKEKYREIAQLASGIFKEFGALQVVEGWGDDVPEGKVTSFRMAVKCKEDETVVFSWVLWPSKEVRNAGMAKLMEDDRIPRELPLDAQRMIFGGFEPIVGDF